jgi:hypothetical protein
MRRIAVATSLALLAGFSPVLEATGSFSAAEPTATLQQVSVTIEPGGRVRYHFSAIAGSLAYTGEAVYDPLTRRAQEQLKELNGNVIQSRATCDADPWLVPGAPCADGFVSSKGYSAASANRINTLAAPIGAHLLEYGDRMRIKAEFERAAAAKAAAEKAAADKAAAEARRQAAIKAALAKQSATEKITNQHAAAVLVPTAPSVAQLHSSKAGLFVRTAPPAATPAPPTKAPAPTATSPAPVAYPPYGAAYTPGSLAQIKVNQPVTVSVTVKNASSQVWPANGAFHLSYHWYRGGILTEFDGQRTFLVASVLPGGQVVLNANVRGPASPGPYTIKWDMVQEGVTWFSNRGVPTADRPVNAVP